MYTYSAYNLGLHSAIPLPELVVNNAAAADVTVCLGTVDQTRLETLDAWHGFRATPEEACYVFADTGAFLVRHGREIVVDPHPQADPRAIRLAVLGPAMALVLHQRGHLVLHASAVAMHGQAVAFLGHHGWGKSTMAAALHQRGHTMLTDDVTAIALHDGQVQVIPSFPQFKLWPEPVAALGEAPDALPMLLPSLDKRAYRVTQGAVTTPHPLTRLYVLAAGPVLASVPLPPPEAVRSLLSHWYGARFGNHLLRVTDLARHFRHCTTLASHASVHRLQRPACLTALASVARLVEEELTGAI